MRKRIFKKLIEVNRRLRQPLFPPFCGAFRRRLVLREGPLRRDNRQEEEGKKRLICPQVHLYRDSLTGLIRPVSLYLQTFSSDLFAQRDAAVSSTWCILASISMGLYLSVFTCGEKACIAKQKKRYG